ncbi:MAG TPA: glycosyltransferase family 2 protein [Thermoleophilaceae bacterium]
MSAVDASVLVPVLNEEAFIRDTVAAMQAQDFDGEVEFLFMDGGSEDRTRELVEELAREDPRIRLFDNPGRTSTAGLNVGLRHARGEYVVRMDAHTFYPPDYIARGIERLRRGDVVWVAGPVIPEGRGKWSRRVALALGSWLGTGGSARLSSSGPEDERELDTGVFAGMARREVVEAHGGWDEEWRVNQDSELAARILADGGRIVSIPALASRYVPRDDLESLAKQYWRYGTYRAKTASRHPNSLEARQLFPLALVGALAGSVVLPRALRGVARLGVGAYGAALGLNSARVAREAGAADGAGVAAVLAVMHLAWGFGFVNGSIRFGPPVEAFARMARGD